jgi:hypothetical protein
MTIDPRRNGLEVADDNPAAGGLEAHEVKKTMRPLDGEFVHSAPARRRACRELGHPLLYLNLSKSIKSDGEVWQCHCGKREETRPKRNPEADHVPA